MDSVKTYRDDNKIKKHLIEKLNNPSRVTFFFHSHGGAIDFHVGYRAPGEPFLQQHMTLLKEQGITHICLEEIPSGMSILNAYISKHDTKAETFIALDYKNHDSDPHSLSRFINRIGLIREANKQGIIVVPIDIDLQTQIPDFNTRFAAREKYMLPEIKNLQQDQNNKIAVLLGGNHYGLAQKLRSPAIYLEHQSMSNVNSLNEHWYEHGCSVRPSTFPQGSIEFYKVNVPPPTFESPFSSFCQSVTKMIFLGISMGIIVYAYY